MNPINPFTINTPGGVVITVGPGGPLAMEGITITYNAVTNTSTVVYAGGVDYPILYCQLYQDGQPYGGFEFTKNTV